MPFPQRKIHCGDVIRQRRKGFGLGAVNYRAVTRKYTGRLMEDKGNSSRFLSDSSPYQLPFLGARIFTSSW